jgi:hypothetical protein
LNEILEKYYEDVFDGDVWSSETTNAIYLIGVATNNWYKNNIPGAYKNLELVKLKNVEIAYVEYVSLFYQLTLLKISFSENNQVLNKTAYNALRKLIAKTHFQRFETLAKPYLI